MNKMCMNVPFLAYLEQFLLFICVLTAFQESFFKRMVLTQMSEKRKEGKTARGFDS